MGNNKSTWEWPKAFASNSVCLCSGSLTLHSGSSPHLLHTDMHEIDLLYFDLDC